MILNSNPNRLLVFFFYDRDGIVDRYVSYMLDDMKKHVKDIIVVVNGKLSEGGYKAFGKFTDKIIVRPNEGLDVYAYKTGLEYFGWDGLRKYDEIILMNHTIVGPVYPFAEMFDSMDKRDLDFWGITMFYKTDDDPFGTMEDGYIPDHIQSHYIAVRKSLFDTEDFHSYWDDMPMIKGYLDSVTRHESKFTKYFEKKGYKWEVYVDAEDLRPLTHQPVIGMPKSIIKNKRCPIFKRRSFMQDYSIVLNENMGQEAFELFKYLEENTDYDTDMLLENLLRLENQAVLKKNLQWNYVLPSDIVKETEISKSDKRIALVMHIHFADLIGACARYASAMPEDADIFITTNTDEKKQMIEEEFSKLKFNKLDVRVVPNRGRDVGPFLVEFQDELRNYDIICHTHDKKAGQTKPGTIGTSFAYNCFESVLKSKEYVLNVINLFEKNKRMGMIAPPPPNHADYYITLGLEWGANFGITRELAESLGINVPMNEKIEPIAPLGSYFWARKEALLPLFSKRWSYEDFPEEPVKDDGTILHAIERLYPFSAQAAGLYPGWVMTEEMAAIEITNLNHMLRSVNDIIFFTGQDAGSYQNTRINLVNSYNILHTLHQGYIDTPAALYYADKNEVFCPERLIMPVQKSRRPGDNGVITKCHEVLFDEPKSIGKLRFDPKEHGKFTLFGMTLVIYDAKGFEHYYGLQDAAYTNGIKLDYGTVFLSDDPQVVFELEKTVKVKKIVIVSRSEEGISENAFDELTSKLKALNF